MPEDLTPHADLRPAQLGVVLLGRVIFGQVSATLVDLAQRGFLRIDEIPGDDQDWRLTDLRDQASARAGLLGHQWSAPHDHGHSGYGAPHGGHGGGYRDRGSGHGGFDAGGHHGGH